MHSGFHSAQNPSNELREANSESRQPLNQKNSLMNQGAEMDHSHKASQNDFSVELATHDNDDDVDD